MDSILTVLKGADRPLTNLEIRKRSNVSLSKQEVNRILYDMLKSSQVVKSGDTTPYWQVSNTILPNTTHNLQSCKEISDNHCIEESKSFVKEEGECFVLMQYTPSTFTVKLWKTFNDYSDAINYAHSFVKEYAKNNNQSLLPEMFDVDCGITFFNTIIDYRLANNDLTFHSIFVLVKQ